jgi:SAM-dependent methyltransferase
MTDADLLVGAHRLPQACRTDGARNRRLPVRQGRCRFCTAPLRHVVVDLGMMPLANSYVRADQLSKPEVFHPLRAYVCEGCFLVQLEALETPDQLFSDYAYFSSYSDAWLEHARTYVERMVARFRLTERSRVLEVASNDGYLLQYFVQRGVPVLGIEPAANVAAAAMEKGIPTRVQFFGEQAARGLAAEGFQADLIVANNVLAHVPDLNGFIRGLQIVLKPDGIITIEFPHLLRLLQENQFDTIYHEHFSYFSLYTARRILAAHGLTVFEVDELPTHGGSLRIYLRHEGDASRPAAYGAPAKGNVLLNYSGIDSRLVDYTVDRSPHKQGRFLPGSHIPILHPSTVADTQPDFLLILPWNLKEEIMDQMGHVRAWGGRFIVPIPELKDHA